jgi:FAD/FMN-containing dehydrogenase/Fe-S oxidoreductase
VLNRGGGTSLAGQCTNVAVVIDSSKYCTNILEIDVDRRIARVEPGVRLDDLRTRAEPLGLTFGPDPATHAYCTFGGMIGNNSGGVHAVRAGLTVENVEELDVLTYDGLRMTVGPTSDEEYGRILAAGGRRAEIYRRLRDLRDRYAGLIRERYPDIPRPVSGYGLDQLLPEKGFNVARALVGSEGTCVTVLGATLRLIEHLPHTVLLVIGFDDICNAADCVPRLLETDPQGLEAIDDLLVDYMTRKHLHHEQVRLLPRGCSWMMLEFGAATVEEAADKARHAMEMFRDHPHVRGMKLFETPAEQADIWEVREAGLGGTAFVPGADRDTWPGWEDSAVAREKLGDYLRALKDLYRRYGYEGAMYGHFGDGLVHTRIDFGLHTPEAVGKFRSFMRDAAILVTEFGGSMSGEHGDGRARSELLPIMFGPELVEAFAEFKSIWDPRGRMNPRDIVDPTAVDSFLRLGPDFRPPEMKTHFQYPQDDFSFDRALIRCVGVGKCRRMDGDVMCPSYRATLEEKHSTRGRAHLLQEMLQGDPVEGLWRNEAVHEALDLCLSCKGCKNDCPVNVDMATYKAEFLAHHYEGKRRPRAAYSMGMIHRWARMASPVPWLPNVFTGAPGLARLSKAIAGIHPDRPVPAFAAKTFRSGFRPDPAGDGRPRVMLWTDTFNNHFSPGPLHAAARVLRAAGYAVDIPGRDLCCGRPLYEFGFLDEARRTLDGTLDGLKDALQAGTMIVGVEPSCMSVFRDELPNLFAGDDRARRLCDQARLLSEFLVDTADWKPPPIAGKAVVHGHCHHKSVFTMAAVEKLLAGTGLDADVLGNGCCGMAGAFGYEPGKYEVSRRIFEHELAGPLARADAGTRIVADGFSCRSQISDLDGRRPLTLPELLAEALPPQNT